jgi:hypothetical protein
MKELMFMKDFKGIPMKTDLFPDEVGGKKKKKTATLTAAERIAAQSLSGHHRPALSPRPHHHVTICT